MIIFSACGQTTENTTHSNAKKDWNTLNKKNFAIQYPSEWKLNQSGLMGSSFIIFSQLTGKTDKFKENVNLIIQDLTNYDMSLDQFVKISENQIKTLVTSGKIISSERKKKNDMEFQKLIYTGKQGIYDLKYEQYFWIYNNNAYVLTLTCEVNQYNDFKIIGEKILNSFEITKN